MTTHFVFWFFFDGLLGAFAIAAWGSWIRGLVDHWKERRQKGISK